MLERLSDELFQRVVCWLTTLNHDPDELRRRRVTAAESYACYEVARVRRALVLTSSRTWHLWVAARLLTVRLEDARHRDYVFGVARPPEE